MALTSRLLASGSGWRAEDVICSFGPQDRPFAEQYDATCIAAVTHGTFQYRSTLGSAVLAPGALLLGERGHCFECGHEHGIGDRCLSFHLAHDFLEGVAAAIPGVRRLAFTTPRLPPAPALLPIIAAAEAARPGRRRRGIRRACAAARRRRICGVGRDDAPCCRTKPTRRTAHLQGAAPDRGASGRTVIAARSGVRGGDESVSLPAHLPHRRRDDAAPIHPAHAALSRSASPAPDYRGHRDDRIRRRLWRSLDV